MSSRYSVSNLIVDPDKAFIEANIKELKRLAKRSYTIPDEEQYRLDLISNSIYGVIDLKWFLLYVNDIIDISVLKSGVIIKYLPLEDVLTAILKSMEKVNG